MSDVKHVTLDNIAMWAFKWSIKYAILDQFLIIMDQFSVI